MCLVDEVAGSTPVGRRAGVRRRRLEAEPIAFLVALTDEEAPAFRAPERDPDAALVAREQDALAVVSDLAAGRTSTTVARQIVDAAGGVPLLLTELVASMTRDQLEGRVPLPDALPAAPDVEDLYLRRVRELPEGSRDGLLVAAATRAGRVPDDRRCAGVLGLDADALEDAARAGVVDVADIVRFLNPAVRIRRICERVRGGSSGAFTARWHPSWSTRAGRPTGLARRPGDARTRRGVAARLERSASRAAARSGCAAAAAALERAAELSDDGAGRARADRTCRGDGMARRPGRDASALCEVAEAVPSTP